MRILSRAIQIVFAGAAVASVSGYAGTLGEQPPTNASGVITNDALVKNQDVAKVQGANAITLFMNKGSKTCDDQGENCRSVFGADDNMDYTTVQLNSQSISGVDSFAFQGNNGDSNNIAAQTGNLAVACGDTTEHVIAGIAFKATSCLVNTNGDAKLTYQVCTAPSRNNPIKQPDNAVDCSTDPTSASYRPPAGKVCKRPACNTEPLDSLNGWSSPKTISWTATLPSGSSDAVKTNNGLGLTFYPALSGSVTPSFTADSDNMTAVKIVQSYINSETKKTALGMRVAFRHKTTVTAEQLTKGATSVPNPTQHTAEWDTIEKLQNNAVIPKLQQKYAQNGTECLTQIQQGVATDGKISVCDQTYTNESGIKPIAKTARVAASPGNCGTTAQCLELVVNNNSWTETCMSDVPLAMRKCETVTDYISRDIVSKHTRSTEICTEKRLTATYSCVTKSDIGSCSRVNVVSQGGLDMSNGAADTRLVLQSTSPDGLTFSYLFGTIGEDYWGDGYYNRQFAMNITDVSNVKKFLITGAMFDDTMAISVNGTWVYSNYGDSNYVYNSRFDKYGVERLYKYTTQTTTDEFGGTVTTTGYIDPWGMMVSDVWCSGRNYKTWYECQKDANGDIHQLAVTYERATNWTLSASVDIRPYLREGTNIIRMDVGVIGGGQGWFFFDVSAYKEVCNFTVTNSCSTYEAAK